MKKAMVMPIILVITLLISILIATYLGGSSVFVSKQYHRDLAEVRGYWGAYGAKELNQTVSYVYNNYEINVEQNISTKNWEWNLTIPIGVSSGINNNDIYTRVMKVDSNKKIIVYIKK